MKFIVLFILIFFVIITWLSMIIPYIGDSTFTTGTWDNITGDLLTGDMPLEKTVDSMGL